MSKTKSVIRISENFTIRKIEPKKIAENYFMGKYKDRTLPQTKIKSTNAFIKIGKDVGQQSSSEIFQFKDKNNNYQTIYTTNHTLYQQSLENCDKKPILKCKYCKRGNLLQPVGLPISMETQEENIIFYTIDAFCDFGCAFSFLKRKNSESRLFRNSLYMNAEQMLYCFYYRVYPNKVGEKIKEKPDWDLLRENGGSLTNEEFDSDSVQYIPIPSLIMFPAKKQYIKINKDK